MIKRSEEEIMKGWKGNPNRPLVSICTITYNHEKYITEALDSFLMQETDFPFEIVIDDDCSPDRTADIIQEYKKRYPNIINAQLKDENIGMFPNFAENLHRAKGKYLALCEGDDYWTDPEKLQIQIELMQGNPECYLCFHQAGEVIDGELTGKNWGYQGNKNKIFTDMEMFRNIGGIFCPTASMVLRRDALVPIFENIVPAGDNFLQYLGSINGGALYIAKKMSIYRRDHPESITTNSGKVLNASKKLYLEQRENVVFWYVELLDNMGHHIDQKYRKEIDKTISKYLYDLVPLYLETNQDDEFKSMIVRTYKQADGKVNSMARLLYYVRFSPNLARAIVKLRDAPMIEKIFSKLKKTKYKLN